MAVNDFSNQNIQDTYQRVVQTDGTNVADGTGSLLPISFEGNDVIIPGALKAQSYIVSESIVNVSSGSTVFGDSSDDSHSFNGAITASGDISSSGQINADKIRAGNYAGSSIFDIAAGAGGIDTDGPMSCTVFSNSSTSTFGGRVIVTGGAGSYIETTSYVSASEFRTTGNITASGNISASGTSHVLGGDLTIGDDFTFGIHSINSHPSGHFVLASGSTSILSAQGTHLTASGDISSSGTITAKTFVVPFGSSIIGQDSSGNTNDVLVVNTADSLGVLFGDSDHGTTLVGGAITLDSGLDIHLNADGGDVTFADGLGGTKVNINTTAGHITASGNISASGNVYVGNKFFINNKEVFEDGGTILLINEEANFSDGVQINRSNFPQPIIFYGNVTASGNISASGNIITPQLHFGGTGTNDTAPVFLRHIETGDNLQIVNGGLLVTTGHITASGNISSSGNITADTLISNNIIFTSGSTSIKIEAPKPATTADGADLTIESGDGNGAGNVGGDLILNAGRGSGNPATGQGGNITLNTFGLLSGGSSADSGSFIVNSSNFTLHSSGDLNIDGTLTGTIDGGTF